MKPPPSSPGPPLEFPFRSPNLADVSEGRRESICVIPDHELHRRIGRGSYGEVWLARNVFGEYRAVKIVWRREFGDDDRPFQREFEGIQRFEPISRSHPSQLAILHVGKNDGLGCFYYVMELADSVATPKSETRNPKEITTPNVETTAARGEVRSSGFGLPSDLGPRNSELYTPHTLRLELTQRGALPIERALELGLALTTALAHLHEHGLVHRDIKPSNIIFVGGRPKLADIGLVTDAAAGDDRRSIVGTEGYLAPEGPGTPQADLFALGKVLYEVATGLDRRQFPQLPPDLRTRPEAHAIIELNEILLKACAHDPREGYQSTEQMRDDLELLQRGQSVRRRRFWQQRVQLGKKLAVATMLAVVLLASLLYTKSQLIPRTSSGQNHGTKNLEARNAFQLGLLFSGRQNQAGLTNAIAYFEKAVALDPGYAEAWAALADTYSYSADWDITEPRDSKPKALVAALRALQLDDSQEDAYIVLANYKATYEWDWAGAENEFQRVLARLPNNSGLACDYGQFLMGMNRKSDAIALGKRAEKFHAVDTMLHWNMAFWLYEARRDAEALDEVKETIRLDPGLMGPARTDIALLIYEANGLGSDGIAEWCRLRIRNGESPDLVSNFRDVYEKEGSKAFWEERLSSHLQKIGKEFVLIEHVVYLETLLGHDAEALDALERAYEHRAKWLARFLHYRPAERLRAEPRFQELLKTMGFNQ